MCDEIKEVIQAVDINALIGVILGFLLGEWSHSRKERKQAAEQRKSVRSLLRTELDANRSLLQKAWDMVSAPISGPADEPYVRCKRFIEHPYPPCKSLAYESQMQVLPSCVDSTEIGQLHDFHCRIDRLRQLHQLISHIWREEQGIWDHATEGTGTLIQQTGDRHMGHIPRTPFHDRSGELWKTLSTDMPDTIQLAQLIKIT